MRWSAPPFVAVLLAVASLAAGCSEDSQDPVPGPEDQQNATLAQIDPAAVEAAGMAPTPDAFADQLINGCMSGGATHAACKCASDAVTRAASPGEIALLSFNPETKETVDRALTAAVVACVRTGSPPHDLGLRELTDKPIEVSSAQMRSMQLFEDDPGQVEDSILGSCTTHASDEACGCLYDTLRADFDEYEIALLGLGGPSGALSTPYMAAIQESCTHS